MVTSGNKIKSHKLPFFTILFSFVLFEEKKKKKKLKQQQQQKNATKSSSIPDSYKVLFNHKQ